MSDIRRKTDIEFFECEGYNIKTIRISASEEVRRARGWVYQSGVDDAQSECGLDDFTRWDLTVENDGIRQVEVILNQILALIPWMIPMNSIWNWNLECINGGGT